MKKISLILAAVLCMSVQNVNAKKQYEGIWAQTTAECLDKESPNTRTLIDLSNKVKGKSLPIFDGYESHCKIIKSSGNDKNAKLKLKCFEFWENLEKNIDGSNANVTLTLESEQTLKIDGVKYERCND